MKKDVKKAAGRPVKEILLKLDPEFAGEIEIERRRARGTRLRFIRELLREALDARILARGEATPFARPTSNLVGGTDFEDPAEPDGPDEEEDPILPARPRRRIGVRTARKTLTPSRSKTRHRSRR